MKTRDSINSIKSIIREPYAWPGGYAKLLVMHDGEFLCADCTKENYRLILRATKDRDRYSGWQAIGTDIYWEGSPTYCAHCNKELLSEYGDDMGGDEE